MNQVYLSGRIGPIVIQSKENEVMHVTSAVTVSHTTAAGVRKEEAFPISAWRGTAQQLLQQARKGSHVMLQGYLSWKLDEEKKPVMEITVKEFQVSGKLTDGVKQLSPIGQLGSADGQPAQEASNPESEIKADGNSVESNEPV